jgi:hypothetical protein
VPEELVLDAPSALVELGVGVTEHVERVGDQGGLRCHEIEHPPVGAGEVESAVGDGIPEGGNLFGQSRLGTARTAIRDDVEELAPDHVDRLGGELLDPGGPEPHHEHVEAKGGSGRETLRIGLEQVFAVGDDGVVHGVPRTVQLGGHFGDAPGVATDLERCPPGEPVVRSWRAEAIRSSSSVHDVVAQSASTQCIRRLCHARRVGRPYTGRSTRTTTTRSFTWATEQ